MIKLHNNKAQKSIEYGEPDRPAERPRAENQVRLDKRDGLEAERVLLLVSVHLLEFRDQCA